MLEQADIEQLRTVRKREDMALKPSPYLKSRYVNDNGEEADVVVRNYQKVGVMNLLMVPSMLLGDDTGLGKTLEVLSAIGYVWLKEPEYVPVIVTTKSALFQWEAEVKRFMQDMHVVTVHGEPFQRHEQYREFFLNHDPAKKRLLILTYDHVMYDSEESVIKSEAKKAKDLRKGFNKEVAAANKVKKAADAELKKWKDVVQEKYAGAHFELQEFVRKCSKDGKVEGPFPAGWTELDTEVVGKCLAAREDQRLKEDALNVLKEERAPSQKVPGISQYMTWLQEKHPGVKFMLVMDEMHKLKNHKSQFHLKTQAMSCMSERRIGMTATPVKNRLMEFWSLFHILQPELFPKITHFKAEFCVEQMQRIAGGRQIPVVVGYRNLEEFVRRIEFFYLSRKKYDVAKELPKLISVEVECELSPEQDDLYDMAEAGLLDELDKDDSDTSGTLRATTACLQAVDAPQLLKDDDGEPFQGESSKLEALIELLEGSAEDKKVIVYSKFEQMITLIEQRLVKCSHKTCGKGPDEHPDGKCPDKTKRKYSPSHPCVRITGKESDPKKRRKAAETFQKADSGVNVILITNAGSESINLQSAEHFVFFDLPWSYGDYLQLIGRMIRIGSMHGSVIAHHFIARRIDGSKTIDDHVLKGLKTKKKLADKVAGENLQGALEFQVEGDATQDALASLMEASKGVVRTSKRLPPQAGGKEAPPVVRKPEEPDEPEEEKQAPRIALADLM